MRSALTARSFSDALQLPQVREERGAFLQGGEWAIDMHAAGGDDRRDRGAGHVHPDTLEELGVVVDDLLQSGRAVVVEIRRRLADSAKRGHVELVPVVLGRGSADESSQQRTTGIGTGAAD